MIRTVIATTVSQMTANGKAAGSYVLTVGSKNTVNALADHKKLPLVALNTPIVNKITMHRSGFKQREYPIQLWFIWKSDINWTDAEHDQKAIQPAELAVNDFLNRLELHPSVESVKQDADELEFTNMFDINTSGKAINLTIKLRNTNSICTN